MESNIEKGSAFYLLRRRNIDESIRVYEATRKIYERIVGPIPLQELTEPLPAALVQIPPLCWGRGDVMKIERKKNIPRLGDMVVCSDSWGTMTIGFFTTRGYADNMLESYPFVTWPGKDYPNNNKICGFLYLPGT
jgi:hypothetical protein